MTCHRCVFFAVSSIFLLWLTGATPAVADCQMQNPDLSIAGVQFFDAGSARRVVGESPPVFESNDDLPHAKFVTDDGAQELSLFVQFDADNDTYSEAEVREATSQALILTPLTLDEFVTGRKVRLGMTPADVVALFGPCVKAREVSGNFEIIQYEIAHDQMPRELKSLGFQTYFAEYEFEDGALVRFRFGFENP